MNATSEKSAAGRQPEELERTADRIRADLDRTLGALERKLSPSQLLDRSLAYLREHGGDITRSVGDTCRRHPVPIALTAVGIGWLIATAVRKREADERSFDDTFGDESPYAGSAADTDIDDESQPGRFRSRFRNRMASAREQTRRAGDQIVSTVAERPLLFGGFAVAIGALIGAAIPATEYEDRVVGEVRDRAVDRAKQMGERQYQNLRSRLETHQDLEVSGQAH